MNAPITQNSEGILKDTIVLICFDDLFKFLYMLRRKSVVSTDSVGRCVIPCAFFGKSVKHTFSCIKMCPVEEKRCLQFFFGVLTSQ